MSGDEAETPTGEERKTAEAEAEPEPDLEFEELEQVVKLEDVGTRMSTPLSKRLSTTRLPL